MMSDAIVGLSINQRVGGGKMSRELELRGLNLMTFTSRITRDHVQS